MRIEQRRRCMVPIDPPATAEQLSAFLSRPMRPLRGLLHADRLCQSAPGLFDYVSRPYGVAGWTLQPHVRLQAQWQEEALHLRQLESRVDGLGEWQQRLHFGLEAWLTPMDTALRAEALVWAEVPTAAVVMAGPVLNLGLQQLLDRLERRCQNGLRRRAQGWLARNV